MSEKELNFEDTMAKLEKIADDLENGNLNLDDTVKKFEEGMELSKKATKILESAEKRINILIQNDGELKEENFVNEEE